MKKFFAEFKEFINRGSVVDMAVGIMIGAAFKAIVDSLVNDIISPLIGLLIRVDFNELAVTVFGVSVKYGAFIMSVLNFLIIALVLFLLVKTINSLRRKKDEPKEEEPAPAAEKQCPYCKSQIAADATRCPHCTSQLDE